MKPPTPTRPLRHVSLRIVAGFRVYYSLEYGRERILLAVSSNRPFDDAPNAISTNDQISFDVCGRVCKLYAGTLTLSARDFRDICMHNVIIWHRFSEAIPELLPADEYRVCGRIAEICSRETSDGPAMGITHAKMRDGRDYFLKEMLV